MENKEEEKLKKQGVYYILWLPFNEYWYVGQSTDIERRLRAHINSNKNDWHAYFRTHLDEFEYKEIELVDDVNELRNREDYYIDLLKPKYTSKEANKGSQVGHLSDETKDKISAKLTGVPKPYMAGDNNPMNRPEVAAKVSAAKTGVPQPWMAGENNPMKRPEVRAKITGENNPNKRPEERAKRMGKNNPSKRQDVRDKQKKAMIGRYAGQIWITNDKEELHKTEEEFNTIYKQQGYRKGRKQRA